MPTYFLTYVLTYATIMVQNVLAFSYIFSKIFPYDISSLHRYKKLFLKMHGSRVNLDLIFSVLICNLLEIYRKEFFQGFSKNILPLF